MPQRVDWQEKGDVSASASPLCAVTVTGCNAGNSQAGDGGGRKAVVRAPLLLGSLGFEFDGGRELFVFYLDFLYLPWYLPTHDGANFLTRVPPWIVKRMRILVLLRETLANKIVKKMHHYSHRGVMYCHPG